MEKDSLTNLKVLLWSGIKKLLNKLCMIEFMEIHLSYVYEEPVVLVANSTVKCLLFNALIIMFKLLRISVEKILRKVHIIEVLFMVVLFYVKEKSLF